MRIATKIVIMAITTNNSMSVKPEDMPLVNARVFFSHILESIIITPYMPEKRPGLSRISPD